MMDSVEKQQVITGALKYGGSFAKSLLTDTLIYADDINAALIKKTWPELWQQYYKMGEPRR